MKPEIRAIINQCGIAMELHNPPSRKEPITIVLIRVSQLGTYRDKLAESNPDMRYASIGQLAIGLANRMFTGVTVSQSPWTYNASSDEYARCRH